MNSKWVGGLYWVGALVIVAYFGVRIYGVVTAPPSKPADMGSTSEVHPILAQNAVATQRIPDFHLFGELIETPIVKSEPSLLSARPSTRDYRIAGLAQARQPERSSVLLELKPGDMSFFRVNDQIEPGVKVARIQGGALYLEVNGRMERLDVPVGMERLFIPVRVGQSLDAGSDEYDWSWLERWDALSDMAVAEKLGLVWQDEQWVITHLCPFLSSHQIRTGFVVLGVNGVALQDKSVKRAFEPVRKGEALYIMLQTSRKRVSVRWKR